MSRDCARRPSSKLRKIHSLRRTRSNPYDFSSAIASGFLRRIGFVRVVDSSLRQNFYHRTLQISESGDCRLQNRRNNFFGFQSSSLIVSESDARSENPTIVNNRNLLIVFQVFVGIKILLLSSCFVVSTRIVGAPRSAGISRKMPALDTASKKRSASDAFRLMLLVSARSRTMCALRERLSVFASADSFSFEDTGTRNVKTVSGAAVQALGCQANGSGLVGILQTRRRGNKPARFADGRRAFPDGKNENADYQSGK